MTKQRSPVKVTGGGGFLFEDYVASFFALQMLAGRKYFGPNFGAMATIHFQARDLGWLLDDIVVAFAGDDEPLSLAVSVKSNRQVTRKGFPPEFVRSVWEQWFGADSEIFVQGRDALELAVGVLADTVRSTWDEMLRQARDTAPDRVAMRLTTKNSSSAIQRAIFLSLQCPNDLRNRGPSDASAAAQLLRHLRLFHFDFFSSPSNDLTLALEQCQSIVQSENQSDARQLWQQLLQIVAQQRTTGGTLDLKNLVDRLKPGVLLKPHPNHRADWERLNATSHAAADRIRDQVGDGIRLDRSQERSKIVGVLKESRAIVLIGESGCGKSVLAKHVPAVGEIADAVVWLTADALDQRDQGGIRRYMRLNYELTDVLGIATARHPLLILDAIDRYSSDALAQVAYILQSLSLSPDEAGSWRVLVTCGPSGWEHVARSLLAHDVNLAFFRTEVIGYPSRGEIKQLLSQMPSLRPLSAQVEVYDLLKNLKILDWVAIAAHLRDDSDLPSRLGLANILGWVWEYWIGGDADEFVRSGILQKLADIEGTGLVSSISVKRLTLEERRTLGNPRMREIVGVRDEKVQFLHDLTGDCARLRILIGAQNTLEELKERAKYPRWHRAIRLYGQHLLDRQPSGASAWKETIDALKGEDGPTVLARDLLLESVVFAGNASGLLEIVWSELYGDEGALWCRLLKSFLHSATFPDPRAISLANTQAEAQVIASNIRVPYGPYWLPVISAMHKHVDQVVATPSVFEVTARMCQLWLSSVPLKTTKGQAFPGRSEAAELVVKVAREIQGLDAEQVHLEDDVKKCAYEALLCAAPDLPDEVSMLILELVRRRGLPSETRTRAENYRVRQQKRFEELMEDPEHAERMANRHRFSGASILPRGPRRDPWTDGPRELVDRVFQEACMCNVAAFQFLIEARPSVAREVLLAACIEPPGYENPYASDLCLNVCGTRDWPGAYPPLYFRGPFLRFLQTNPQVGLDAVLRLVNFATERWADSERRHEKRLKGSREARVPSIQVYIDDVPREWLGNERVYGWYRGLWSSNSVACALMALEKWLYDELDAGRDITAWTSLILKRSHSVAFAGVLAAVGLRKPQLFDGPLRAILGVWRIYEFQMHLVMQGDTWQIELLGWAREGEFLLDLARDWHLLPHRKELLRDRAVAMLLTGPSMANFFSKARSRWTAEMENTPNREDLELLIARFDPANYSMTEREDGAKLVELEWPEPLRRRIEEASEASHHSLSVLNFPIRCRQLLDQGQPLIPEDLSAFWDELLDLTSREPKDGTSGPSRELAAAICGGIAVIFVLHRDWIAGHPEREKWCTERMT